MTNTKNANTWGPGEFDKYICRKTRVFERCNHGTCSQADKCVVVKEKYNKKR